MIVCFILSWVGANPVAGIFIAGGLALTGLYFFSFLVIS